MGETESVSERLYVLQGVRFRDVFAVDDLVIRGGRMTVLRGRSGSGKTTALRFLNRMTVPDAGTILFEDRDIAATDPIELRRRAVMLGQAAVMFAGTVRAEVAIGCEFASMPAPTDDEIRAALDAVRLAKTLDDSPAPFSGGEKQRLALARIIVMNPPVLLLDEPTAALDPETEAAVFDVLRMRRDAGRTVIVATHSQAVESLGDLDLCVFEDGRLATKGRAA